MKGPRLAAALAAALALGLGAGPRPAGAQELAEAAAASQTVERLQRALTETIRRSEQDLAARVAALAPVVEETHDLDAIARLALGRHWASLTPEQQARYLDLFRRLSVVTYAARFGGGSGARFAVDAAEPQPGGRVVVRSRLLPAQGKPVAFEYHLQPSGGRLRIVNVVADGVSDLALRRAESTRLLAQGGFAALEAELRAQIEALEKGSG